MNMEMLKLYANKGFNVLFSAPHGVGKTQITKAVFESVFGPMGKKWLYFSASTLDPWVDLVGVPHKGATAGGNPLLVLLRPAWVYEDIEAIFFDEINRAPDKVRNALMELIQFGTINGHKMTKLKVVWAAENPWDEQSTYSVEKLDPAQRDRFQIQITLPSNPSSKYFREKFGEVGAAAVKWWESLNEDNKKQVSPRRLEDSIHVFMAGGNLSDMFTSKLNPSALTAALKEAVIKFDVETFFNKQDADLQQNLTVDNLLKFDSYIAKNEKVFDRVVNLASKEVLESSGFKKTEIYKKLQKNKQFSELLDILAEYQKSPSSYSSISLKPSAFSALNSSWDALGSKERDTFLEILENQEDQEKFFDKITSTKVKKSIQNTLEDRALKKSLNGVIYHKDEFSQSAHQDLLTKMLKFEYFTTYPDTSRFSFVEAFTPILKSVYVMDHKVSVTKKDFMSLAYYLLTSVLDKVPQSHIRNKLHILEGLSLEDLCLMLMGSLSEVGVYLPKDRLNALHANGRALRSFASRKGRVDALTQADYEQHPRFLEGKAKAKKVRWANEPVSSFFR